MKKEIIKYLNKLETKDFSAHCNSKNGKAIWSIGINKDSFYIEVSNDLYEEKKIELAFHKDYDDVKVSVETQEIQNFINTLRKRLESENCRKNASEEKREELINIFKQAKTIDKFLKESVTRIEGNEEKMFCFRSFDNPERYALEQLKFHHIYATEMTRDKRLTNEFYSSKDYEFLISNKELCEIFEIDLEKEKKEFFTKNFGFILKVEEAASEEIKKEVPIEEVVTETISNKIKKFL